MREIKNSAVLLRARETLRPRLHRARPELNFRFSLFFFPSLPLFLLPLSFFRFVFLSILDPTDDRERPLPPRFAEAHYQRHIRNLIERLVKNRVSKGWNSIRFERIVLAPSSPRAIIRKQGKNAFPCIAVQNRRSRGSRGWIKKKKKKWRGRANVAY